MQSQEAAAGAAEQQSGLTAAAAGTQSMTIVSNSGTTHSNSGSELAQSTYSLELVGSPSYVPNIVDLDDSDEEEAMPSVPHAAAASGALLGAGELNTLQEDVSIPYSIGALPSQPKYLTRQQLDSVHAVQLTVLMSSLRLATCEQELLVAADALVRFMLGASLDVVRYIQGAHVRTLVVEALQRIRANGSSAGRTATSQHSKLGSSVDRAMQALLAVATAAEGHASHVAFPFQRLCCSAACCFGETIYASRGVGGGLRLVWMGSRDDDITVPERIKHHSLQDAELNAPSVTPRSSAGPRARSAAAVASPLPSDTAPLILRDASGTYAYEPTGCLVEWLALKPLGFCASLGLVLVAAVSVLLIAGVFGGVNASDDTSNTLGAIGGSMLAATIAFAMFALFGATCLSMPCCGREDAVVAARLAQQRTLLPGMYSPDGVHEGWWYVFTPAAEWIVQLRAACELLSDSAHFSSGASICVRPVPVPPMLTAGVRFSDVAGQLPVTVQQLLEEEAAVQVGTGSPPYTPPSLGQQLTEEALPGSTGETHEAEEMASYTGFGIGTGSTPPAPPGMSRQFTGGAVDAGGQSAALSPPGMSRQFTGGAVDAGDTSTAHAQSQDSMLCPGTANPAGTGAPTGALSSSLVGEEYDTAVVHSPESHDTHAYNAVTLRQLDIDRYMHEVPPPPAVVLGDPRMDLTPFDALPPRMEAEHYSYTAGGIQDAEAGLTTQDCLNASWLLAQLPHIESPAWPGWHASPRAQLTYCSEAAADEWIQRASAHQLIAVPRAPLDTLRAEAAAARAAASKQEAAPATEGEPPLPVFPGVSVYTSWARSAAEVIRSLTPAAAAP